MSNQMSECVPSLSCPEHGTNPSLLVNLDMEISYIKYKMCAKSHDSRVNIN